MERIFAAMYKILRSLLFFFPPEGVHHFSMKMLRLICGIGPFRKLVEWSCRPDSSRHSEVFGLVFRNPVGLGAGFDKNALYLRELKALGFGYVEIGTVTPKGQAGNEQPRLFRLPQDQGLINRMGFNNDGVEVVVERLKAWRGLEGGAAGSRGGVGSPGGVGSRGSAALAGSGADSRGTEVSRGEAGSRSGEAARGGTNAPLIIGGNIGKNKVTPNEDAWKDYETCFRALYDVVDYFVVNVSSPNTPGLRALQERDSLHKILTNLQSVNRQLSVQKGMRLRPLLLKIAPDLNQQQLDDVISLALEINLDGLVATNTTIGREGLVTAAEQLEAIGAGGLSGAPLRGRATEVVAYCCEKMQGRIPVIASGGIFTAEDAKEKLDAGATLVQVWTGFIYVGPLITRRICEGL